MSQCLNLSNNMDIQNIINRKALAALMQDNFTILVIFIIVVIFLTLILYYFVTHLRTTLRNYKQFNKKIALAPPPTDNQYDKSADDEQYTKTSDVNPELSLYKFNFADDPMEYIPKGTKDFLEDVDNQYRDYNDLKGKYIKGEYKRANDDVVNQEILFSKNDDYAYAKKEEETDDY